VSNSLDANFASTELETIDQGAVGSTDNTRACKKCFRSTCGGCHWTDRWDGNLEFGLNGSEGNSRNVNFVFGFDAKRKRDLDTYTIDWDYLYSRDDVEVSKNRLYMLNRFERDIPDTNWSWFADAWFEFDEQEDFRSRLGLHAGIIRTFVDCNDVRLRGLFGLGTSREFEGADQDWKPEAFIGGDWEKKIADRQKCYIRAVYYPEAGEPSSFRMNTKAGWEIKLSDRRDFRLSISAFDRYDSTPSGDDRRNNIDYWMSFIWGF